MSDCKCTELLTSPMGFQTSNFSISQSVYMFWDYFFCSQWQFSKQNLTGLCSVSESNLFYSLWMIYRAWLVLPLVTEADNCWFAARKGGIFVFVFRALCSDTFPFVLCSVPVYLFIGFLCRLSVLTPIHSNLIQYTINRTSDKWNWIGFFQQRQARESRISRWKIEYINRDKNPTIF